jgi:signal recognition particle subunit SRP54
LPAKDFNMFDTLSEKFQDAFKNIKGQGKITEANVEEAIKQVRTALLEADVNFKVVKQFTNEVKEQALGTKVIRGVNPQEQFIKIINDELTKLMGEKNEDLELNRPGQVPILICGLNGAGKTTFTGKLALFLRNKKNKDVYLVPADNFRPAAKEQLIVHAKNLGVDYFDSDLSMTPKQIVDAAMSEAAKLKKEVVDHRYRRSLTSRSRAYETTCRGKELTKRSRSSFSSGCDDRTRSGECGQEFS